MKTVSICLFEKVKDLELQVDGNIDIHPSLPPEKYKLCAILADLYEFVWILDSCSLLTLHADVIIDDFIITSIYI